MKRLMTVFILSVLCAPGVFYVYLKNDLVCAPRAIVSSALFGLVPLLCPIPALITKKKAFFIIAGAALLFEMLITPVIMLKRLGWEKLVSERLPAFFTFEGIALAQLLILLFLWKKAAGSAGIAADTIPD